MLEQLTVLFAELDADVLERQTKWVFERREALSKLRSELYATRREIGEHAYYKKLFDVCGGKTWYDVIDGRGSDDLKAFVRKNVAMTAEKRNISIVNKLQKAGATSIVSSEYARSHDGFHGMFVVMTDAGAKNVKIQTIVAGGYNIQCLHQRTLVKILK